MLNLEWIGDTGSAQDLIAERDLQHLKAYESEQPINIMTANGPSSADKQCDVDVPSIAISAKPYVLPDTPSVLSIGQRCMEQGFDFIWRACTRPYLKTPEGERVFLDVRDNVPFLKSWKEGTACPARESKSDEIQSVARGEMPDRSSEEIALQLLEKHDFSERSCVDLLRTVNFGAGRSRRKALGEKHGNSKEKYVILGAFAHGGFHGVTKRTGRHVNTIKYLIAFLRKRGAELESCSSLCINQNSPIKVHKDVNNHKDHLNVTIAVGEFSNGGLWIHDPNAMKTDKNYLEVKDSVGTKLPGMVHDSHNKIVVFDPKTSHFVRPWKGERWSITAYTCRSVYQLDNQDVAKLRGCGFVIPHKRVPIAPASADDPDERTLRELMEEDMPVRPLPDRTKPTVKLKAKPKPEPKAKSEPRDGVRDSGLLRSEGAARVRAILDGSRPAPPSDEVRAEPDIGPPAPAAADAPDGEAASSDDPEAPERRARRRSKEALIKESRTREHLMTHVPKNPYCQICQRAKMYIQEGNQYYRSRGFWRPCDRRSSDLAQGQANCH